MYVRMPYVMPDSLREFFFSFPWFDVTKWPFSLSWLDAWLAWISYSGSWFRPQSLCIHQYSYAYTLNTRGESKVASTPLWIGTVGIKIIGQQVVKFFHIGLNSGHFAQMLAVCSFTPFVSRDGAPPGSFIFTVFILETFFACENIWILQRPPLTCK